MTAGKNLVAYQQGSSVTLTCSARAWPRPIIYWNHTGGGIVLDGHGRHTVEEERAHSREQRRDEFVSK